jgi:hypothetical protein
MGQYTPGRPLQNLLAPCAPPSRDLPLTAPSKRWVQKGYTGVFDVSLR